MKVGIIGAGASGVFAALILKQNYIDTTVIERNANALKKIYATGNGRCNFTNRNVSYKNYHGENPKFTISAIKKFDNYDVIEFFNDMGIPEVELEEVNPMLGFRGLRLGVRYPEISKMQARAIIQAAMHCHEDGIKVVPEIMIPLSSDAKELAYVKTQVREEIEKVFEEKGKKIEYLLGTMIEIPRAAITADEIGEITDFFSFGTNDLTQMTFGLSRDDAGKFLKS